MKKLTIIFLITFALLPIIGHLLSGSNVIYSFIWGFYVFFIFSVVLIKTKFFQKATGVFFIPVVLLFLLFSISFLENGFKLTMENFVFIPGFFNIFADVLGICTGYLVLNKNILFRMIGILSFLLLSYINIFKINPWIESWIFYISFKTTDGLVSRPEPTWEAFTSNDSLVNQNTYNGKTLLLDFWNTTCVICIKKFPILDSLHNALKNDTNTVILSVNIPRELDTAGMAYHIVNEKGFTFPLVIGTTKLNESFNFNSYPKVFIIKNDTIVFYGDIEKAAALLKK